MFAMEHFFYRLYVRYCDAYQPQWTPSAQLGGGEEIRLFEGVWCVRTGGTGCTLSFIS